MFGLDRWCVWCVERERGQLIEKSKVQLELLIRIIENLSKVKGFDSKASGFDALQTSLENVISTAEALAPTVQDSIDAIAAANAEAARIIAETHQLRTAVSKSVSQQEIKDIIAVTRVRAETLDKTTKDYEKHFANYQKLIEFSTTQLPNTCLLYTSPSPRD